MECQKVMSVMEDYTADKKGGMEVLGDLSFKWDDYTGISEKVLFEYKLEGGEEPYKDFSQHRKQSA